MAATNSLQFTDKVARVLSVTWKRMAATKACGTTIQSYRTADKVGPAPLVVHGFATVWMLATFPHLLFFTEWVEMARPTLREEEAVGQARQVKFTTA